MIDRRPHWSELIHLSFWVIISRNYTQIMLFFSLSVWWILEIYHIFLTMLKHLKYISTSTKQQRWLLMVFVIFLINGEIINKRIVHVKLVIILCSHYSGLYCNHSLYLPDVILPFCHLFYYVFVFTAENVSLISPYVQFLLSYLM